MATMPVQFDEEALMLEIIRGLKLPEGVTFKRLVLGTEWTGEPAWHIYFSVSKKIPLTKPFIHSLNDIRSAIYEKVFPLKLDKWPFAHFEEGQ